MRHLVAAMLALMVGGNYAHAYEVHTHAHMTKEALTRSFIPGSSLFIDLGIYGVDGELLLPMSYWDMANADQRLRRVDFENNGADPRQFELSVLDDLRISRASALRLSTWMLRGAIREDDIGNVPMLPNLVQRWGVKNPWDDAYNPSLARPLEHFFDPILNRPLTNALANALDPNLQKAPDWALGVTDAFQASLTPDPNRRNHFTVLDAREAMWRALTGTRFSDGVSIAPTSAIRSQYWATVFRALGDTLHLLQDMAQPQHTRNDPHAGLPFLGEESGYELRVNERVIATAQGTTSPYLPAIDYGPTCYSPGGYCPVTFNGYVPYFSSGPGSGILGNGLADYSNRGFFTADTNLGRNSYALPSNNPADYAPVKTTGLEGRPIQVLLGNVPDNVFPLQSAMLTASSPFSKLAATWGQQPTYYFPPDVLDEHARLLLPRAVAYSAGFINYFFRGTLEIALPDEKVYAVEDFSTYGSPGAGFKTLKLRVRNSTQPVAGVAQNTNGGSSPGTLIAVLSYRRNACLKLPSLEGVPQLDPADTTQQKVLWDENCRTPSLESQALPEAIASAPALAPPDLDSALQPVVFTFSTPLPFDATDVDLQIIYRGPLGAESDAIAVGLEHISEPGFVNFDNFYDCFTGTQGDLCRSNPTDPSCIMNASIKLPFYNVADQPGWRPVASVTNLLPGQYARVAYLSRSAFRPAVPDGSAIQVTTNQRFAYDVVVTFDDGTSESWPAKKPVTTPFKRSRPLSGSQSTMYSWGDSYGAYQYACGGTTCGAFDWANTCPAIDPTPQRVTVMFPNP